MDEAASPVIDINGIFRKQLVDSTCNAVWRGAVAARAGNLGFCGYDHALGGMFGDGARSSTHTPTGRGRADYGFGGDSCGDENRSLDRP